MDTICDKNTEKVLWDKSEMMDFCTKSRMNRREAIWAEFERRVCGRKAFKPYEKQIRTIVQALNSWICMSDFKEYIIIMLKELQLELLNSFFLVTSPRVIS